MSKPVTENALATAWPGNGLPNAIQSRIAHGQEDQPGDDGDGGDEPDARRPAERLHAPRDDEPGEADVERLVAGQRGEADQHAEGDEPRVGQPAAARVADEARHQQAGRQGEHRERHRRVGQGRVEEQRQVDRRRQPGPDGERPGALARQAALLRDVGRQPPGEDRDERADEDRRPLGRRERRAEDRHRDRRQERRQRQPHLEGGAREHERRRLVAPQRVGDEPAALDEVPGDAEVVGGVLGLREDDLAGERRSRDQRARRRRSRPPVRTASRRVTARPATG